MDLEDWKACTKKPLFGILVCLIILRRQSRRPKESRLEPRTTRTGNNQTAKTQTTTQININTEKTNFRVYLEQKKSTYIVFMQLYRLISLSWFPMKKPCRMLHRMLHHQQRLKAAAPPADRAAPPQSSASASNPAKSSACESFGDAADWKFGALGSSQKRIEQLDP